MLVGVSHCSSLGFDISSISSNLSQCCVQLKVLVDQSLHQMKWAVTIDGETGGPEGPKPPPLFLGGPNFRVHFYYIASA